MTGGGKVSLQEEDGEGAGCLHPLEAGLEADPVRCEEVLVDLAERSLAFDQGGPLEALKGVVTRGERGGQGVEPDRGRAGVGGRPVPQDQVSGKGEGLLLPRVDEDCPLALQVPLP